MDNNNELNIKKIEKDNTINNAKEIISKINTKNNITNDEIINKLPDWNIEPPIEIKRGVE